MTSKQGERFQKYDARAYTEHDCRRRAEIPIYSFAKHARQKETTSIYSPHVLVLEGIFALYDPRVLELLDMKARACTKPKLEPPANSRSIQIFCEADADTCLSRRILRDVAERGRDIEGCIKQWFAFVKPNFEKYVEPQRKVAGKWRVWLEQVRFFLTLADIIVPRGVENRVAICKYLREYQTQILIVSSYGDSIHRA